MRIKYLCFSLFLLWSRVGLTAESKPRSRSQDDTTAEESKQEKMTFLRTHKKKIAGIGMPVALITTACILLGVRPQWRYAIRYTVKPPTQEDFIDALQKNDNHYLERVLQYMKDSIDLNKGPEGYQSSLEYVIRTRKPEKLTLLLQGDVDAKQRVSHAEKSISLIEYAVDMRAIKTIEILLQNEKTKNEIAEEEIVRLFCKEATFPSRRDVIEILLTSQKAQDAITQTLAQKKEEIFTNLIKSFNVDALLTFLNNHFTKKYFDEVSVETKQNMYMILVNVSGFPNKDYEERSESFRRYNTLLYLLKYYSEAIGKDMVQKSCKEKILELIQLEKDEKKLVGKKTYYTLASISEILIQRPEVDLKHMKIDDIPILSYCIREGLRIPLMLLKSSSIDPNKKHDNRSPLTLAVEMYNQYNSGIYSILYHGREYGKPLYKEIIQALLCHPKINKDNDEYKEAQTVIDQKNTDPYGDLFTQ